MPEFRYAQFCPLARAAEVLGERWTLLVIRELLLGPKRFSDLKRALRGVSTSVLSERLARLEARGVVERTEVRPPTPATLYVLTELGERLRPTILELTRWGGGLLAEREEGDHMEPDWLRLGVAAFARRAASPARTFEIHLDGAEVFQVAGGPRGTRIRSELEPADVVLRVRAPLTLMALLSGYLDPDAALRAGEVEVEGDPAAFREFPELFDMSPERSEPHPQQGA